MGGAPCPATWTSWPRTMSRTGSRSRSATPAQPFTEISNGAPGIETLLAVTYGTGVPRRSDHPRTAGRRPVDDARAPVRDAPQGRHRGGTRRRPGAVRPDGAACHPPGRPAPHERLHALRGAGRSRVPSEPSWSVARTSSATAGTSGRAAKVGTWRAHWPEVRRPSCRGRQRCCGVVQGAMAYQPPSSRIRRWRIRPVTSRR